MELLNLYKYGDSSHLYWSYSPVPVPVSLANSISIFKGLYREMGTQIIPYDPTQVFKVGTKLGDVLLIQDTNGNYKPSGLYVRSTHISLSTKVSISSLPPKAGVTYALNITEAEFNNLKNTLPPFISRLAAIIDKNTA